MPQWNLRATAQVSQSMSAGSFWLPMQTSAINTALCHIGCKQDVSMQSFLQMSSSNGLQSSQEVLLLCLVALIFVALVAGGIVFWFTVYESGKSLDLGFDEETTEQTSKRIYGKDSKATMHSRRTSLQDATRSYKKVSVATRLFPSYVVGSEFSVKGTLSTDPEDLILKVIEDGSVIGRVLVCETAEDPGILIEDAFNAPLAFIDTSEVVNKTKKSPTLYISKLGEEEGEFGSMRHEENNSRLVIRGPHGKFLIAFSGSRNGESLTAVDEHFRLVGSIHRVQGTSKVVMVPEVDAGMMMCGLLAVGKLGKLGPPDMLQENSHVEIDLDPN